jgi:hypothetical protein
MIAYRPGARGGRTDGPASRDVQTKQGL